MDQPAASTNPNPGSATQKTKLWSELVKVLETKIPPAGKEPSKKGDQIRFRLDERIVAEMGAKLSESLTFENNCRNAIGKAFKTRPRKKEIS